ncbi:hypothetical protein RAK27_19270 [Carnobacterium maltaromaticum]|uniref:Uncharacterized protein n=1 Tax=Carnobacterium maltaromaticum TaxID=2751 RepID=A0AAW9K1W8_CARML|nr:hypothetical protein [Carnobacterium maltaromaticum]MDZ5760789.1 hypothetical protein [Carnobacterium maltaromaticum]
MTKIKSLEGEIMVETEKLQEKLVEVLCEELDLLKKKENNLKINEFAYLVDSLRRLKEVEKL